MSFSALGLKDELLQAVSALGFTTPMPIQTQAIPLLLPGDRDCIALAQTGTGKTAAFGLSLLHNIVPRVPTPQAVILCPTRELCMQIAAELRNYSRFLPGVRTLAVYGGSSIRFQMVELRRGVSIVVATPGRLLDLMNRRAIRFDAVRTTVLDEADEMLQMGFQEDIEDILSAMPETSHTWMFSATMERSVAGIAHRHLRNPIEMSAVTEASAPNIEHVCKTLHPSERSDALRGLIDRTPDFFGLVFRRTRRSAQELAETFTRAGYPAASLHGDLSQPQRDRVMRSFRNRQIRVLIATDVAARSLDVSDVTHIIHYDLPDDPSVYTHRSGRTARAGKAGISIAYASPADHPRIARFERMLNVSFDFLGVPRQTERSRGGEGGPNRRRFGGRPQRFGGRGRPHGQTQGHRTETASYSNY